MSKAAGILYKTETSPVKRGLNQYKSNMNARIKSFKRYWSLNYSYVALNLSNKEIEKFLLGTKILEVAVYNAIDYLLANRLAEVQE